MPTYNTATADNDSNTLYPATGSIYCTNDELQGDEYFYSTIHGEDTPEDSGQVVASLVTSHDMKVSIAAPDITMCSKEAPSPEDEDDYVPVTPPHSTIEL